MASLLPVLPLLAASLPACAPEREKPGGADTTGEAPWDAEVSAAPLSMDAGWGTVTSSSRLEVSWSSAEAPKVQVQASLGAHTVITQVDGATTIAFQTKYSNLYASTWNCVFGFHDTPFQ